MIDRGNYGGVAMSAKLRDSVFKLLRERKNKRAVGRGRRGHRANCATESKYGPRVGEALQAEDRRGSRGSSSKKPTKATMGNVSRNLRK